MPTDRLYTIPEVAELLRHGRTRVYQLIDEGRLPSVVVGPRARRVRESDLQRLSPAWMTAASSSARAVPHERIENDGGRQ